MATDHVCRDCNNEWVDNSKGGPCPDCGSRDVADFFDEVEDWEEDEEDWEEDWEEDDEEEDCFEESEDDYN